MRVRSLLSSSAVFGALLVLPGTAFAGGSVGSPAVYPSMHGARAGHVEAFRSFAAAPGAVTRLNAYLAPSNTATRVELGLYRNHAGQPSKRIARCAVTNPRAGAWNSCTVKAVYVSAGRAYWAALLRPMGAKGTLRFRVTRAGRSRAMRRSRASRTRMPRAWKRGRMMMKRGKA